MIDENAIEILKIMFSLWQRIYAQNIRLYYPYRQFINLFLFRFVSGQGWAIYSQHE